MMIKRIQPYIRQIFICTNSRHGESTCCGYRGSEEIVDELKRVAKDLRLKGKIRVAKSGCLDLCAFGPNLMIWPEGIWYLKVTKQDIPSIVETFLTLEGEDKKEASEAGNLVGDGRIFVDR
jgi:(2Fe-2S) ferredoxin